MTWLQNEDEKLLQVLLHEDDRVDQLREENHLQHQEGRDNTSLLIFFFLFYFANIFFRKSFFDQVTRNFLFDTRELNL